MLKIRRIRKALDRVYDPTLSHFRDMQNNSLRDMGWISLMAC